MRVYKILKKSIFEGTTKFEKKINHMALEGWRVVTMSQADGSVVVILEKEREY